MAELKLRNCPFCGGTNITILSKKTNIWRNDFGDCVEYRVYSARCNRCNARGATAGGQCAPSEKTVKIYGTETLVHSYKYYHDKAAEAWNTRYLTEYTVNFCEADCWISCKERMPENGVPVLITSKNEVCKAWHDEYMHKWYLSDSDFWYHDYDITHWMPMPDAYKPPKEK